MKVALISQKSHCKHHKKALKGLGFRVMELGGSPTSIPRSIHFAILRTDSCGHGASDIALAWKRRSPDTRVLAFANGVSSVKQAAQHYLEAHKGILPKKGNPVKPQQSIEDNRSILIQKLPAKIKFILDFIEGRKARGCGVESIRMEWWKVFGGLPPKSTVGTYIARLKSAQLIYNIGSQGRNQKTKSGVKYAWYVSSIYPGVSMADPEMQKKYKAYCAWAVGAAARYNDMGGPVHTPLAPIAEHDGIHALAEESERQKESRKTVPVKPEPKLVAVEAPEIPTEAIRDEVELLVLWMRVWNVDSITLSRSGEVTLSDHPTEEPELAVWFVSPENK